MRSKILILLFGFVTLSIFTLDKFQQHPDRAVVVDMVDGAGNDVGVIVFQPVTHERVLITVNLYDVSPGFHGFHIHEIAVCEGDFTSAGGHFDLQNVNHGQHSGDLPLLEADESGHVFLAVHTARFNFNDLFDDDGSAFVVHEGADNVANIPDRYGGADATTLSNGDAGGRFACGVISRD